MNKALILVMCDVLVLSAMSLSNGGFGDGLERRRGCIDVTQEFNVAKDALKKTEEALKASELRLQQRARELADMQAQKRRDDDAHKGELAEMSATLTNTKSQLEMTARELADVQAQKRRDDDAHKGELAEMSATLTNTKSQLEMTARELADVQAQKRRDDDAHKGELAEMSATLTNTKSQLEMTARELADVQAQKRRDDDAHKGELAEMSATLTNTKSQLEMTARELADVQTQKRRDDDAHKGELAEMSARLKVAMMSEAEHRKAIDDTCVAVTVKNKDGREDRKFYSPLIDINGNTYVMVYMYKKKELENMSAIFVQGRSGEWDEVRHPPAYYIDDCNQELNIVLFELKGNHSSNRLTLGKRTGGTLQFWVSRDTGLVWRPQGTSITEKASDWWQQKKEIWLWTQWDNL